LPLACLSVLDEQLQSAQLDKLNLVRDHPGQSTFHKFSNTIAGLAILKLPPVFACNDGQMYQGSPHNTDQMFFSKTCCLTYTG
jgi:hypothetical protein